MPQKERNSQFHFIEEKIRTYLLVHSKSVEKKPIHFDEFEEIKSILVQEFNQLELSLSDGIRWLYLRWLSVNGKIGVEVEKKKYPPLTAADLEMTEEQFKLLLHNQEFSNSRFRFNQRQLNRK